MTTTLFGSLNTAFRALQTMQMAIQTTGHNTANAATPGYSRQRVIFSTSTPYTIPTHYRDMAAGQVGTGVTASAIRRYRSEFLDTQIRQQTWSLKGWETRQNVLQQVEVVLNEPSDTGISAHLGNFFSAWQDLAATPDSMAARAYVAETAAEFSGTLRQAYGQLDALRSDLNDRLEMQVTSINDLAHRIADLNESIAHVESLGQQPNDLRDERDAVLKELSGMLNVTIGETDSGSYWVSTGGRMLVADRSVREMAVEKDTANDLLYKVTWADTGETVTVKGVPLDSNLTASGEKVLEGALGGTFVARDLIINRKMSQLDDIATAVMNAVNSTHQTGYDINGNATAGQDFFTGTGARDIEVSAFIDSDYGHIATAGAPNAPGDGSVALAIYQLSDAPLMNGGTTKVGDFYRAVIGELGQDTQQANIMTQNHQLLVDHLQNRQEQIAGVSLDEESVHLLEYQRTYQAAARVMTTVDEMLDKVINGMGLIGR